MPEYPWNRAAFADRGKPTANTGRHQYGEPVQGDGRAVTPGAQVFAAARHHLDARHAPHLDLVTLRESVTRVEAEVARGDAADEAVVVRALRTIRALLPELAVAMIAGLVDPSAGMPPAVRRAAESVRH
jgi:hypothetical protein